MNRSCVVRSLLVVVLTAAWLPGCGRQTPADNTDSPESQTKTTETAPLQTANNARTATNTTDMVLIPGGRFLMGDPDEVDAPLHEVEVSSFLMDRNLVTQEQYEALVGKNPSRWKRARHPVEQLRWSDAVRYCNERSKREGLQPCYAPDTLQCDFEANGYRLPTEAEWEYACRAGTTTRYFFGDNPAKLGEYAWFEKNAGGHPHPVGQKQPNPWGLQDIVGNVWEWCNDFYGVDSYTQSPRRNPRGPSRGENKVLRGGAWRFSADNCRSGYRYSENPGQSDVCFGYDIYGFRCVRNSPSQSPPPPR